MDSDLMYVLGIMKCTDAKRKYEKYILDHQDFLARIPRSAVDVINVCTNIRDANSHLTFILNQESGEEEAADMCKALREIKREAERRGIEQGRQDKILRLVTDTLFQEKLF